MAGTIRRRASGAWQIRIYLGHDDNGRPIQKSKTVRGTKRQAEDEMARMLLARGEGPIDDQITLERYLTGDWWTFKRPKISPTTAAAWESATRVHIVPDLGDRRLADIRAVDLDAFYARLEAKGLGPARIRQAHTVLSAAFRQAEKWELIRRAPTAAATPPPVRRTPLELPSADEVATFIDSATDELRVYLEILVNLGTRRSEALALQWGDIDLDQSTAMISKTVVQDGARLVIQSPKTGRTDMLRFDATVTEVLRRHRVAQAEKLLSIGQRVNDQTYLFGGRDPWRPDRVTALMGRHSGVCGVKITATMLRHFTATMLFGEGADPRTVAGRLRHARPSTTLDRYAEYLPTKDREASEIMTRVLRSGSD